MHPHSIVAEGLQFPEGPIAMDDGSLIFVEIKAGRLTRLTPDGRLHTVAMTGGGPNGAAIGPDGAIYVCNNGGFTWSDMGGLTIPGAVAADYTTGRIERVDIATGRVERLYDKTDDGLALSGPNDLVFDAHGGFWFTDLGKHFGHHETKGGLFYAKPDGSGCVCAVYGPNLNGVGLSPDGTKVYAAVTAQRVILEFDVTGPGTVAPSMLEAAPGRFVSTWSTKTFLDSLAMEANGNIAQATLIEEAGVTSVDPGTGAHEFFAFPDLLPTNVVFGGEDMMDAWVCLSTTGKMAKCRWPRPGLRLHFNA